MIRRKVKITPGELRVIQLIIVGDPNKIISYKLGISESTIKVHIRHLFKKLGATNRTHLAYLATMRRDIL